MRSKQEREEMKQFVALLKKVGQVHQVPKLVYSSKKRVIKS